jgi:hypothetical protein
MIIKRGKGFKCGYVKNKCFFRAIAEKWTGCGDRAGDRRLALLRRSMPAPKHGDRAPWLHDPRIASEKTFGEN